MVQKQINIATKQYNISYLHKLEKYFINSNEAKLIVISQTLSQYYNNFTNSRQYKYLINDNDKFNIFKRLFNIILDKNQAIFSVLKKIKQNLINICIQPTFKAKLNRCVSNYFNFYKKRYKKISHYVINHNDLKKHNIHKNCLITLIVRKLNHYNYINKLITYWLYENLYNYNNLDEKQIINYNLSNFSLVHNENNLQNLILKVILIDTYWAFFHIIQVMNSFITIMTSQRQLLNQDNFLSLTKTKSLLLLSVLLNFFLYARNKYNKLKLNIFLSRIIRKIYLIFIIYFSKKKDFFSQSSINKSNMFINVFLYNIFRKQKKMKLYTFLKENYFQTKNSFFHKYIYKCNINSYYAYLF
uniref:Reverse transcriptase N-terminal domain-containing protein n=1 Tax=Kuetzingia canaliculata TaxID=228262 RepID=A0A1Z1MP28_KUECA|nr:hypothetical protein [Kuetzingia canaliculata]ARW67850.1 hypothetical protein [Kuetzingia canaliculata]